MSIIFSLLFIILGSLFLYFGAEGLVSGSSSVAFRMRITPLVVGLTIVAFGTSSPELVVSISAALRGNGGIALGNVIGSNICNIALILGISALIRPIKVNVKVIQTDITLMIGMSILMVILVIDGMITRVDGAILASGIVIYNVATIYISKRKKKGFSSSEEDEIPANLAKRKTWLDVILIIGGLVILVLGANLFLEGAVKIASALGATDALIGLTIVSLGTSLPELATSVVAAIKNEGDISIGNAIGSNIFNILCILGIASLVRPIYSGNIESIDLGVMLFVSVIIFPLARIGLSLTRIKGLFLLMIYFGYMFYLYNQIPG